MSAAERRAYREQGFVLVRGLFRADQLARFEARFEDLVLRHVARPERMVVMQDVMVVKGAAVPKTPLHAVNKLLSFEDDPVLFGYALEPALLARVRSLIGTSVMTISSNVFNKPPDVDGRHPLHQDLRYFSLRPAEKIVATWTAIDACRRENGCLAVVPGSHRGPLLPHGDPDWEHVNRGFFSAEGADREQRQHVEMDPGDTLFFHPLLLHGSGHNRSDGFRRAISVHYAAQDCERPGAGRRRDPVMKPIPDTTSEAP